MVYEQSTVAFIDILGFKEALNDVSKARDILDALTEVKKRIEEHKSDPIHKQFQSVFNIKLLSFSDSIIISGYEYQAIPVLFAAVEFSQILIEKGFLCRGGVACGELYHKNEIIFGNSFVQAYEIEHKQAIYPRIVLDNKTLEAVEDSKNEPTDFSNLIRADKDGSKFLNIIYPMYKRRSNIKNVLSDLVKCKLAEKTNSASTVNKLTWLYHEYGLLNQ